MTVFAILIGKKTSCLLPRKELRQIEPKMRCFCISTIEIRERLWFKMRMELGSRIGLVEATDVVE